MLGVFNEREESLRLPQLAALYAPDARFADHDGVAVGLDAINEKIRALHARTPGFVFAPGPFHEVQDLATIEWSYGPAGADPVVNGTDVAIIRDGRISALYVYLR
nr:nuclear transport factor 2 family protein [Diaminobutyricibacter tongyongensis]